MSSLAYMGAGLGQGLMQGKQFQIQRQNTRFGQQMQQQELALNQRSEADRVASEKRQIASTRLADLNARLYDPALKSHYMPEEIAKMVADRDSIYDQNPDLDIRPHIAAQPGQQQPGQQPAPATPPDPNGLGATAQQVQDNAASVSGPAAYAADQASRQPPQASPPPLGLGYNPSGLNGGTTPATLGANIAAQIPNSSSPPTPAPQAQPQQAPPSAPPQQQAQAPQDPDAPAKAYIASLWQRAHDPAIPYDQQAQAGQQAIAQTAALAEAMHNRAGATLEGNQAQVVVPQANASIDNLKQSTAEGAARTKTIAPESTARLGLMGAQTGQAQAETKAIGAHSAIEAGQLDLARSAQVMTNAYQQADLKLRTATLQKEMAMYGLSLDQYKIELHKAQQEMAMNGVKMNMELGTPGFNMKLIKQGIIDHAFTTDKLGQTHLNGPTAQGYTHLMQTEGPQAGYTPTGYTGPSLFSQPTQQQPTQQPASKAGLGSYLGNDPFSALKGNGPTVDPGKLKAYLADERDDPSTKVNVLKSLTIPIPDNLARLAASQQRGGGFNMRR